MLFSSITFLFFFLPLAFLIYKIVPAKGKNLCLCILSGLFYAWGEPLGLFLMLGQIVVTFVLTNGSVKRKGTIMGRILYILSVFVPFFFLFYFKYSYFFLHRLIPDMHQITLPIGISFYTFQLVSYVIDVHRQDAQPQKKLIDLMTYITLFPQLIAGPIVRYTQIEQELTQRKTSLGDISQGCIRFTIGLAKKVLLANVLGEFAEEILSLADHSTLIAWVYAATAAMQIYYDFSGYSDMAIGLGRMFGFHFPENFQYPFISGSATAFWRRWHITLGAWFRDYVYIPLGGNRVSTIRWIVNIVIVWFLTGLWHGAGWNYIIWGLLFAILLLLEKGIRQFKVQRREAEYIKSALCHVYMIVVIMVSFLIFRTEDMDLLKRILGSMFGVTTGASDRSVIFYMIRNRAVLLVMGVAGTTPLPAWLWQKYRNVLSGGMLYQLTQMVAVIALLILCTAYLIDGSFNPFLYFRF